MQREKGIRTEALKPTPKPNGFGVKRSCFQDMGFSSEAFLANAWSSKSSKNVTEHGIKYT